MVIHKLLMEMHMNIEIMIGKCKLATASELRKWSQFTGHMSVNVLLTMPAISTHICPAPTVESWSQWHLYNQECTMLALTSQLFSFTEIKVIMYLSKTKKANTYASELPLVCKKLNCVCLSVCLDRHRHIYTYIRQNCCLQIHRKRSLQRKGEKRFFNEIVPMDF